MQAGGPVSPFSGPPASVSLSLTGRRNDAAGDLRRATRLSATSSCIFGSPQCDEPEVRMILVVAGLRMPNRNRYEARAPARPARYFIAP